MVHTTFAPPEVVFVTVGVVHVSNKSNTPLCFTSQQEAATAAWQKYHSVSIACDITVDMKLATSV